MNYSEDKQNNEKTNDSKNDAGIAVKNHAAFTGN